MGPGWPWYPSCPCMGMGIAMDAGPIGVGAGLIQGGGGAEPGMGPGIGGPDIGGPVIGGPDMGGPGGG